MKLLKDFSKVRLPITVDQTELNISAIGRHGDKEAIVFLHGFGSTKEDYADIIQHTAFEGRPFIAYDAPGCGETTCSDLTKISIPFLMETALAVLDQVNLQRFHLVGHSMGGLTALILATNYPERVLSFINIEGNIAPEDCFLSRQVFEYPNNDDEKFFEDFIERNYFASAFSTSLYASRLRHNVRFGAVRGIFESMVNLSDNGDLMNKFIQLPFPKMFMYGEQNSSLSYLNFIKEHGVKLEEVPACGHFPMYSNSIWMWKKMDSFLHNLT